MATKESRGGGAKIADHIWGMTDREEAYGSKEGEPMIPSDIAATVDLGKVTAMSV